MNTGVELPNGVRLSCRTVERAAPEFPGGVAPEGEGQSALLIHGLNANMAFWRPPLLARLRSTRRLVLYDQRGHGYSDTPPAGYTTLELAHDARLVLDAQGIERADVVAHSFGAGVALQLALHHPERVASLVVLDGRVRSLQPDLRLKDWSEFARWRKHFADVGVELDPEMDVDFRLPLLVDGELWESVRPGLEAEGFFVPRGGKRMRAKHRHLLEETTAAREYVDPAGLTREALRSIEQPVYALYGSISAYLPTRDGLLEELPRCRAEAIEDVGHNFPFLRAEETAECIQRYWKDACQEGVPT